MSTATSAKRKDSGSRAIAGNTCPVITASSGRAPVRRSAGSNSSSGVTARGRRAAVLVLVTKVLRSACVRYASSSPPRSHRGRARILANVSWTRSSALSRESHSADAVRNRRPRCAPRTSGSSRCIPDREGPVQGPGRADGERPSGACATELVPIAAAGGGWLCGDLVACGRERVPGGAECGHALAGCLAGLLVLDEQIDRVAVVGDLLGAVRAGNRREL